MRYDFPRVPLKTGPILKGWLGRSGENDRTPVLIAQQLYRPKRRIQQVGWKGLRLIQNDYAVCDGVQMPAHPRLRGKKRFKKANVCRYDTGSLPALRQKAGVLTQFRVAVALQQIRLDLPVILQILVYDGKVW